MYVEVNKTTGLYCPSAVDNFRWYNDKSCDEIDLTYPDADDCKLLFYNCPIIMIICFTTYYYDLLMYLCTTLSTMEGTSALYASKCSDFFLMTEMNFHAFTGLMHMCALLDFV